MAIDNRGINMKILTFKYVDIARINTSLLCILTDVFRETNYETQNMVDVFFRTTCIKSFSGVPSSHLPSVREKRLIRIRWNVIFQARYPAYPRVDVVQSGFFYLLNITSLCMYFSILMIGLSSSSGVIWSSIEGSSCSISHPSVDQERFKKSSFGRFTNSRQLPKL